MRFGSTRLTSGEASPRRRSDGEERETTNKGDGKRRAAMWPGTIVTQKLVRLHPLLLLLQRRRRGGGRGRLEWRDWIRINNNIKL